MNLTFKLDFELRRALNVLAYLKVSKFLLLHLCNREKFAKSRLVGGAKMSIDYCKAVKTTYFILLSEFL